MSYRPPRPEDRPISQRPLAERVTVVVQLFRNKEKNMKAGGMAGSAGATREPKV